MTRLLSLWVALTAFAAATLASESSDGPELAPRAAVSHRVDPASLSWQLGTIPDFTFPWNMAVPQAVTNPSSGDWDAMAFAAMEIFQTLLRQVKPASRVSASTRTSDLAWTFGSYRVYGSVYLTAQVADNAVMPWNCQSGKLVLGLPDWVQFHIAVNKWTAGLATLVNARDPKDATHYGYAAFKIASINVADSDHDADFQSLPPIPDLIALPAGITKQEFLKVNFTTPVEYQAHYVNGI